MDADGIISRLCTRFRVPLAFGQKLRPLVDKAVRAEPRKRRLLLELVERSFAEESRRAQELLEDWRALTAVAGILHGWNPPNWFERWEDEPPRAC